MNTLINQSNLEEAHERGKEGNGRFNCYCTSLFVLGKREELYWIDCPEITVFINNNTIEVTEIQEGDILVMYAKDNLKEYLEQQNEDGLIIIHTAVYIGNEEWFHKKGGNGSSFVTEEEVRDSYDNEYCNYRRINT